MESYLLDWANLLLRWLHVIVAIAWIGSSFYFVWLDNSLTVPQDPVLKKKGVGGELWALHGGGFYNPQKYLGAPPELPEHVHWFYWESYSTWLSGFGLFSVLYLFNPKIFLIDPNVANLQPTTAIVLALLFLIAGWIIYDALCRALRKNEQVLAILVVLYVCIAAWGACHLFAGRAAFIIVGAMMATIMSANVFFCIIPGQKKIVASMKAKLPVDPIYGQRGKQRSVHNTYFTLPVLFAMLSNHYSMTYSNQYNWLVLILIMLAGVLIRRFFILRHKGTVNLAYPTVAVVLLTALIAWIAPATPSNDNSNATPQMHVRTSDIQAILQARCIQCHAAQPSLMPSAAKGIALDNADQIQQHAQLIYQQVVVQKNMPLGNITQMTDAERARVAQWFEAGANP